MDTNKVFEKVDNDNPKTSKKQWSEPTFEVLGKGIVKSGGFPTPTYEGTKTEYHS